LRQGVRFFFFFFSLRKKNTMVGSRHRLSWLNLGIVYLLLACSSSWSITFNHSELYLSSHNFKISATPQTRNYNFRIRNAVGAPDGFTKPMLVINDQFPAPLIECNEVSDRTKYFSRKSMMFLWRNLRAGNSLQ